VVGNPHKDKGNQIILVEDFQKAVEISHNISWRIDLFMADIDLHGKSVAFWRRSSFHPATYT
jgi:hypothetical protein